MSSEPTRDHRQRDSNSFLLIGIFFLVFGFLVLLGTFWGPAEHGPNSASTAGRASEPGPQVARPQSPARENRPRLFRQRVVNVGAGSVLFLLGLGMAANGLRLRRPAPIAPD